jgi:hypothetical protein
MRSISALSRFSIFMMPVLFGLNIASADCSRYEAQVTARIKSVTHSSALKEGLCLIQLDYADSNSSFKENILCPLDIELTLNPGVVGSCTLRSGEVFSGYVSYQNDGFSTKPHTEANMEDDASYVENDPECRANEEYLPCYNDELTADAFCKSMGYSRAEIRQGGGVVTDLYWRWTGSEWTKAQGESIATVACFR